VGGSRRRGLKRGAGVSKVLLVLEFPYFEHGLVLALKVGTLDSRVPDDEFLRTWYVTVIARLTRTARRAR